MPLWITDTIEIPDRALELRFSRAGGPGGQNVNKVSTRVEIILDLGADIGLPPDALERLRRTQRRRISRDGRLRIVAQGHRDQARNREEALRILAAMILESLVRPRVRRPTRPSRGSRERRLAKKRRRSQVKAHRGGIETD
jgi:ribosome-associated protein